MNETDACPKNGEEVGGREGRGRGRKGLCVWEKLHGNTLRIIPFTQRKDASN